MRALIALFVLGLIVTAGVLVGCPPNLQCSSQNDCPIGQACNAESKCVAAPPPPPPKDAGFKGGEGEGEGGEGEGQAPQEVIPLGQPISLFADPDDATKAVFGEGGALDQESLLTLATGAVQESLLDFKNGGPRPSCQLQNILTLKAAEHPQIASVLTATAGDETWFSCADHIEIEYAQSGPAQRFVSTTIPSVAINRLLIPATPDGTAVEGRVLSAARGDTKLVVTQLDNVNTIVAHDRPTEAVGVTFTHIEGIFIVANSDPSFGDVILVFDRAPAPKLVALQRDPNTTTWHGAPFTAMPQFASLPLPASTEAVLFRELVGIPHPDSLNLQQIDSITPNVIAVIPTANEGRVQFLRYESELLQAGSSTTTFTPPGTFLSSTPITTTKVTDPVLLFENDQVTAAQCAIDADCTAGQRCTPVLGPPAKTVCVGTQVTYAATQSAHAFTFPVQAQGEDFSAENVVNRANFIDNSADRVTGIVPVDATHAWFSMANRQALDLVTFVTHF